MLGQYNTIQETADKLGIKTVTVHHYIKSGYLKAERFGSQWAINQKDIEKRITQLSLKEHLNKHGKDITCTGCGNAGEVVKDQETGNYWVHCVTGDCVPF